MRRAIFVAILTVTLGLLPQLTWAQPAPTGPSTPAPQPAPDPFGERVRAYLLAHPEVIMEAVQILQQRQQAIQAETAKGMIAARADQLFRDPTSPIGGNPSGDVTLVEFFDYNCGYCRSVAPMLTELLGRDRHLRFVFKEFPILGPSSEQAARAALAAHRQGMYATLHEALMQAAPPLTDATITAAAAASGINTGRLQRDMADPAIMATIERNRELAAALGINGTPGFVIAGQVVPGAVDRATLEGLIAKERQARGGASR